MSDPKAPWHLDKKVPIGIIIAGLLTAGSMVAKDRDTDNKLASHDKALAVIEAQRISERLASLESQVLDVRSSLNRIEAKLDRMVEFKRGDRP